MILKNLLAVDKYMVESIDTRGAIVSSEFNRSYRPLRWLYFPLAIFTILLTRMGYLRILPEESRIFLDRYYGSVCYKRIWLKDNWPV